MASPQNQVFAIFDNTTGAPLAGVAIGPGAAQVHFLKYTNELNAALAQPTITEIGGGLYQFTPTFTSNHMVDYIVSTGGNTPVSYSASIRPEDYYIDQIADIAVAVGVGGAVSLYNMMKKLMNFFGI